MLGHLSCHARQLQPNSQRRGPTGAGGDSGVPAASAGSAGAGEAEANQAAADGAVRSGSWREKTRRRIDCGAPVGRN